ncbi:SH3 domain-containing protein [Vibrio mangrovi]|uniref:Uncharacterized protein n=1 Tax=Vibrio mangrovi TaxID=474394 RepID=A0A1Y6IVC4_9VIBR|nr:hypothetical protein [Vibrio mangrovi]MDW6002269.1 hypothetical protein [Vibrio mangrovi]SMS01615.1 hypothetical protein VIM7927_02912 [Vibrio mangrovi]
MIRILQTLLFIFVLVGCEQSVPPPSDQSMIDLFLSKRDVFEQLQRKICNDGFQTVSMDPEWSEPDNISELKKKEYYALFNQIGVTQLQSYDGCRAKFSVWAMGWAGDADYKSYQYRPLKPENVVSSLDNLPLNQTDIVMFYRKIDTNWYISYAHWP